MTEVQEKITELRDRGWTLAALADELGVHRETVYEWSVGNHSPANPKPVLVTLDVLMKRKRIPKKRRYQKS